MDVSRSVSNPISGEVGAAAQPSRWASDPVDQVSNPISGEVGAAAPARRPLCRIRLSARPVSNPISGEVGAAANKMFIVFETSQVVSNPISGEVGAAAVAGLERLIEKLARFKPHQRGGGCCSMRTLVSALKSLLVSNPISGEVGAAAPPSFRLHFSKS